MIIAIDFDDTIHDTHNVPPHKKMGPPLTGAKEALTTFHQQGHLIIIHTVWPTSQHHIIADWMKYFGIPYDEITNVKPNAAIFIDDKALHFTAWSNVHIENWAH